MNITAPDNFADTLHLPVARKTAQGWLSYRGMGQRHFDYLKSTLDRKEAGWRR